MIDSPSLEAVSQLSLLLSVLATCADLNGRNLKERSDPSAKAISASAHILNRVADRIERNRTPITAEEAKVLILCSGTLDRLFRRFPAARLAQAEAGVIAACGWRKAA